jgi:protoporphyrinogen oxidase
VTATRSPTLAILGGGISGLAAAFTAQQRGIPYTLYEATSTLGGVARTIWREGCGFDTGAHRLHMRDSSVTSALQRLLGPALQTVNVPSKIFSADRLFDFPLSPLDLARNLGARDTAKAALALARARVRRRPRQVSFADFAVRAYGDVIADRFLLGYTRKLWGMSPALLAPSISGNRLKNLTLRSVLASAVLGRRAQIRHLEGTTFMYPRLGIGMIADALAMACSRSSLRLEARVTGLQHDGRRILAVALATGECVRVSGVISTLPLDVLVQLLDPPAPTEWADAAARLRFRSLRLVMLHLDRPSVMPGVATLYCPDPAICFTRLSEPRNRSTSMAPPGQSSLVAEVPCQLGDEVWALTDDALRARVGEQLVALGWITSRDIVGGMVHPMPHAYPVLTLAAVADVERLTSDLPRLANLQLAGRGGLFCYGSIHHAFGDGERAVEMLDETVRCPHV